MAMFRVLILIVLVWILYQIVKRIWANAKSQDSTQKAEQDSQKDSEQKMIQCSQCGCHVPEIDSQIINDKIICNNPECKTATSDKPSHGD
jgi:uncharacterized protein